MWLSRNVFRAALKELTVCRLRKATGRAFHAIGTATVNERQPKLVTKFSTTKSPRAAERSRCLINSWHWTAELCQLRWRQTIDRFEHQQTTAHLHHTLTCSSVLPLSETRIIWSRSVWLSCVCCDSWSLSRRHSAVRRRHLPTDCWAADFASDNASFDSWITTVKPLASANWSISTPRYLFMWHWHQKAGIYRAMPLLLGVQWWLEKGWGQATGQG